MIVGPNSFGRGVTILMRANEFAPTNHDVNVGPNSFGRGVTILMRANEFAPTKDG